MFDKKLSYALAVDGDGLAVIAAKPHSSIGVRDPDGTGPKARQTSKIRESGKATHSMPSSLSPSSSS